MVNGSVNVVFGFNRAREGCNDSVQSEVSYGLLALLFAMPTTNE